MHRMYSFKVPVAKRSGTAATPNSKTSTPRAAATSPAAMEPPNVHASRSSSANGVEPWHLSGSAKSLDACDLEIEEWKNNVKKERAVRLQASAKRREKQQEQVASQSVSVEPTPRLATSLED